MSTVHITGWPRHMRDEVTLHPQCDDFGVQQLVSRESIPNECTVLCLEDPTSASEFRKTLTQMDHTVECVFLSNGVDVDGTIHEDEVIMFRRLSGTHVDDTEPMLVNPVLYHFRQWNRVKRTSPSSPRPPPPPSSPSSSAQSEPSWLIEAEEKVENTTPPPPSRTSTPPPPPPTTPRLERLPHIPESRATTPPNTSVPRPETSLVHDSTTVLTIDGVLTPSVLTSLAQPNSIVYLPTCDGVRMALTRVRNAIWLGTYIVDLASWKPETCTYHVTPRGNVGQIAPRRTVTQMHRLRRRQFERR